MTSKEIRTCLLRFLGVLLLGVAGLVLLVSVVILVGPPHMPREDRVEVKQKAAPLPNSVDLSKIDTLISAHSQWVESKEQPDPEVRKMYDLVFSQDINHDGVPDGIRSNGGSLQTNVSGFGDAIDPVGGVGFSSVTSVGFNDVDADSITDAWSCAPGDEIVCVLYGTVEGKFTVRQSLLSGNGEYEGAFFDVDGDGDLDIVLREFKYGPDDKRIPTGEYSWIELQRKQ